MERVEKVRDEVEGLINNLYTRNLIEIKTDTTYDQLVEVMVNILKPFAMRANLKQEYEIKFYCENIPITGEFVSSERLKQGYLDVIAEQIGTMPMFKGRVINFTVRPMEAL